MPDYTLSPVRRGSGVATAAFAGTPGGHSRPRLLVLPVLPLFPARSATFRISDTVSLEGIIIDLAQNALYPLFVSLLDASNEVLTK